MIVPDLNLLIYAYNDDAPLYASARSWWEGLMNGTERVGTPWVVAAGFVRLMTQPNVLNDPFTPDEAIDTVEKWFPPAPCRAPEPRH